MWVGNGDNDDEDVQQLLIIDIVLYFKEKIEYDLICDVITNPFSPYN
jgi:hypothetical protein